MLYHCRFDHEVFSFNHSVDVRESDSNQSGKDQLVIAKSGRGRFRNFFITAYFSLHSFSLHSFHFITAYIFFSLQRVFTTQVVVRADPAYESVRNQSVDCFKVTEVTSLTLKFQKQMARQLFYQLHTKFPVLTMMLLQVYISLTLLRKKAFQQFKQTNWQN